MVMAPELIRNQQVAGTNPAAAGEGKKPSPDECGEAYPIYASPQG